MSTHPEPEQIPNTTRTPVSHLMPDDRVLLAAAPPARVLEVVKAVRYLTDGATVVLKLRNPEGRVFVVELADTSTAQVIDPDQ